MVLVVLVLVMMQGQREQDMGVLSKKLGQAQAQTQTGTNPPNLGDRLVSRVCQGSRRGYGRRIMSERVCGWQVGNRDGKCGCSGGEGDSGQKDRERKRRRGMP